ncbi:MAG: hypothetical protein C0408_11435 [Odoribacter sp.]|nr:hypothetical protein [Odoribacter sp.]
MTTEVSKIESIIKGKLDDETQKSIAQLKEQIESQTQQAVERINNIYASAINTLRQLELTDATIFEFFQKTNGNIRVHEIEINYMGYVGIEFSNQRINERNPIYLDKKAKYKIILMAIEVKEGTAAGK